MDRKNQVWKMSYICVKRSFPLFIFQKFGKHRANYFFYDLNILSYALHVQYLSQHAWQQGLLVHVMGSFEPRV